MSVNRFLFRSWYYFRQGYGLYLSFPLGFISTVTTVYYLMVKNIPFLYVIFPNFTDFVLIGAALLIPTGVFFGWIHMKRTLAYSSEVDIAVEANPYYYRLSPGIATEVQYPAYLSIIRMLKKIDEKSGILTPEERTEMEKLEKKMETLIKGGRVGTPRTKRFEG